MVHENSYTKVELGIVLSACMFIFALAVSAYFEPDIRVLHLLQALMYVFVIIFARHHSKWAYCVGFSIGAFWNYVAIFVNNFVLSGLVTLSLLVAGKQITNAGALIALPAALGNCGMIIFCIWAYIRLRGKSWRDAGILAASAFLSTGYFAVIVVLTAPKFLPLFRRAFHI